MKYIGFLALAGLIGCGSSDSSLNSDNKTALPASPVPTSLPEVDHYAGENLVLSSPSNPRVLDAVKYIASNTTHGVRDGIYTPEQLLAKIQSGERVYITCTMVSEVTQLYLAQLGIQSRLALTLTLDSWTSNDNGHTMLEVWDDTLQKWTLFDLDNNVQPLVNEQTVTVQEFAEAVKDGSYSLYLLASDTYFDSEDPDYDYYRTFVLKSWYEKVVQVYMLRSGDEYNFVDGDYNERVESYDTGVLEPLSPSAFNSLFYGD